MKRLLFAAVVVLATPTFAADVGVSVSIGQPGFYGTIDIGNYPRPQVINPQPVIVERVPEARPPIYLRVPPGHAKHWGKHCHEYHACGERVYFVNDDWYNREYVPRYQERHRGYADDRRGYRDDPRGRRDDRRAEYRDDPRDRRDDRRAEYRDDPRGRRDDRGAEYRDDPRGRGDDRRAEYRGGDSPRDDQAGRQQGPGWRGR